MTAVRLPNNLAKVSILGKKLHFFNIKIQIKIKMRQTLIYKKRTKDKDREKKHRGSPNSAVLGLVQFQNRTKW